MYCIDIDQVTDEIVIHHHVQDGGSSDGTGEFLKLIPGRLDLPILRVLLFL